MLYQARIIIIIYNLFWFYDSFYSEFPCELAVRVLLNIVLSYAILFLPSLVNIIFVLLCFLCKFFISLLIDYLECCVLRQFGHLTISPSFKSLDGAVNNNCYRYDAYYHKYCYYDWTVSPSITTIITFIASDLTLAYTSALKFT